MTNKIVKMLSAKRKIPGTKRPLVLDRLKGRRDFKDSQLCGTDGGQQTTPWITERARNISVYENYIYNMVDRELAPVADMISVECRELEELGKTVELRADNEESLERMASRAAARSAAEDARRKQILMHLAEMRSELEVVDTALKHNIRRAEHEMQKHVSAYWSGVLKAAASDRMPAEPRMEIPVTEGRTVYRLHYTRMMERIEEAMGGEYHEAA